MQQSGAASAAATTVPFVGCASDGQVGPLKAPTGKPKAENIPPSVAARLAYFKAEYGPGVLGPRGWHCLGTYGSNGANLYLSPRPIKASKLFSESWKGFGGSAIQASVSDGGTSGRFEVAKIIERVFPAHESFAQSVIDEGIEPESAFPKGPYPADKLTNLSKEMVEFLTPANADGLGTHSRLLKDDVPIRGVAILEGQNEPSVILLSIRLPASMNDLADAIIKQAERAAAHLEE